MIFVYKTDPLLPQYEVDFYFYVISVYEKKSQVCWIKWRRVETKHIDFVRKSSLIEDSEPHKFVPRNRPGDLPASAMVRWEGGVDVISSYRCVGQGPWGTGKRLTYPNIHAWDYEKSYSNDNLLFVVSYPTNGNDCF